MKIAYVVGARPNFIKLAPVSKELRRSFDEVVIHTGQHYDYSLNDVFFDQIQLPPIDYYLNVSKVSPTRQILEIIKRLRTVLSKERPDVVLVFGDTNSTLAGTLAATNMGIKVAHVEAGVRSFDCRMQEEMNRILVDHYSDLLFCPTRPSRRNLSNERVTGNVYLTGDVMVDSLNSNLEEAQICSTILRRLGLQPKQYHLVTLHRAENVDDRHRLSDLLKALRRISNLVFPCHPRTEKNLRRFRLWKKLAGSVTMIEPVSYWDMLILEKNARKILTDSGGVQKEAYLLKTPCITLRDSTEWPETIDSKCNMLVGVDQEKILNAVLDNNSSYKWSNPFGNGKASQRIKESLGRNALR